MQNSLAENMKDTVEKAATGQINYLKSYELGPGGQPPNMDQQAGPSGIQQETVAEQEESSQKSKRRKRS